MTSHLLADIGKAVVGAAALGFPALYLRVPLLLAYLIAGVILGPHLGFGVIQSHESIATLSEIGLVLLMFILGLEIDIRKLIQAGKAVLVNGVTQFVGCNLLGILFFKMFGYGNNSYELTYLAIACSLSSTLIVVKILSDKMDLDALPSRITLGILVIQDLWAIGFLAIQPNLSDLSALAILLSLAKVGLLVLSCWFLARFALQRIFARAGKHPELMLLLAMAWCFAVCGLADALSISLEMGALVAGVSIASFPYHLDVAAKISSLRDFFITLFFVSLGLQIPEPTWNVLALAGLIIIFVLFSRIITIFPFLHFMKYGNRASLLPALNLSQLSEFSLIMASLGITYKHISPDLFSAFIIAMVVSALISSFTIPSSHRVYQFINPFLQKIGFIDRVSKTSEKGLPKQHPSIVILGFHREASSLLYELHNRYSTSFFEDLLIVDFNPEAHVQLQKMGIHCQYGDISHVDTLRHLHLDKAKLILSTIPDQILKGITNVKLLKILKQVAPQAQIIVTAEKIESAREMYQAGADYVCLPRLISAFYLADIIEKLQTEGSSTVIKDKASEFIATRKEIIP
ncbi:MAG: membrane protein [Oligoflexia bacterium]|nr:MAG: membrane protein [Oligoflexia bacterium]